MSADAPLAKAIFLDAVEKLSPPEWPGFLDGACAGDPGLRQRVEVLLAGHATPAGLVDALAPDRPAPEGPGSKVGPYTLIAPIGEGGMGVVYRAGQSAPVRRTVALKVIRPGMDTARVIARFEAERQALALMDHPNIARVLDAGATASGRPFFVMELVEGVALTEYCDREKLPVPARLELFVQVCRAVQHAHQKGIIHRDLKPSNVLVSVVDGVPVPKVIDFGVAKATGPAPADATVTLGVAAVVGTPLYMSPEQADPAGLDVDTRSDVYGLGVLLYELLTGTTPIGREALGDAPIDEVRRLLREVDPPAPGARLAALGPALAGAAAARGTDPRGLTRAVRGELDWVAMRALEKDRARRYQSAGDLAADVLRHLTGRPVEACPPSRWYRFAKTARRNRAGLTTAAAVALALVAGTVVSLWQAAVARAAQRQAESERDHARRAERQAAAIDDFLRNDLLMLADRDRRHDAGLGDRPDVTVREAIDRAAARIGERFKSDPLTEAAVRHTLGWAYKGVSQDALAVAQFERAVRIRTALLGHDHPDTVESLWGLGLSYPFANRYPEAVALLERVLAYRTARLGPDDRRTLRVLNDLGETLRKAGDLGRARGCVTLALERKLASLGPDHPMTLNSVHDLGLIARDQGRLDEAIALLRRATLGSTRFVGPDHPDTLYGLGNLAGTYDRAGRPEEARAVRLDVVRRVGDKDPAAAQLLTGPMMEHARVLLADGRHAEAEPILRECLAARERARPDDWTTQMSRNLLGEALRGQGRLDEAGPLALESFARVKAAAGGPSPPGPERLAEAAENAARYYDAVGKPAEARRCRQAFPAPAKEE